MKTVNSLSGGKTSSYMAVHYPADYNVFALVTTLDKKCIYPDSKIRQIVSDKIGKEFIGTLEEDVIIKTILNLEQHLGSKIDWVSGKSFDEIIVRGNIKYLPNVTQRFCTIEMKLEPINKWWKENINETCEMRIGFRANEMSRAKKMIERCDENGVMWQKFIESTNENGRNKWKDYPMRIPKFPLIENSIFKDEIVNYWDKNNNVPFAYLNNCVGCFHRNPVLLKHLSEKEPIKYEWFAEQERENGYGARTFKNGMTYDKIKQSFKQIELFDDDFNECDSGYCGL
jgi:hypothetical protein